MQIATDDRASRCAQIDFQTGRGGLPGRKAGKADHQIAQLDLRRLTSGIGEAGILKRQLATLQIKLIDLKHACSGRGRGVWRGRQFQHFLHVQQASSIALEPDLRGRKLDFMHTDPGRQWFGLVKGQIKPLPGQQGAAAALVQAQRAQRGRAGYGHALLRLLLFKFYPHTRIKQTGHQLELEHGRQKAGIGCERQSLQIKLH